MSVGIDMKSLIVIGKTGAGKSKFLNDLIEKNVFKSSASIESCSGEIESISKKVSTRLWSPKNPKIEQEILFDLKVIDTPGIADSQGRSKQFLNEIAKTIKTTPLNLIIVLVEYGRFDTGLYGNLEVLNECLNGMSQSSSMLIVNKVPTEKTLERKRKKGEECRERKIVLDETYKELSHALGIKFKFKFFLENDDTNEAELFNLEQCNLIRRVILTRNSLLKSSRVKTWDDILNFYTNSIMTNQESKNQMNELKREIEDKLDKVEYDIADIKYPFLDLIKEKNLMEYARIVAFECKLQRDEYKKGMKYSSHEHLILTVNEYDNSIENQIDFCKGIEEKLKHLDLKRNELKIELSKCQHSLEEQNKILEEKRTKLIRLENNLVNPYQILA